MKIKRILLAILLFLLIAMSVQHEPLWIDNYVYNHIHSLTNSSLTTFFKNITQLGSFKYLAIFNGIIYFLAFNESLPVDLSVNLLSGLIGYKGLKQVFKRSRPSVTKLIEQGGYSFPSGHACLSFAFYGYLVYYINKHMRNKYIKYPLITLCILLILFIGISRIYLGVHYFSDILAGYLLGYIIIKVYIGGFKHENY